MTDNPLLAQWDNPFGLPPFDKIEMEHFAPAFDAALAEAKANTDKIAANPDEPSFANTIAGMEFGETLIDRVSSVFYHLAGTASEPAIEAMSRDLSPRLAAFYSDVLQDQALFGRVDTLWQQRDRFDLAPEEARVLELYHRMFVRAGAALDEAGRKRLSTIMQRLAQLGTTFSQNLLADERDWSVSLTEDDLAGLPEDLRDSMKSGDVPRNLHPPRSARNGVDGMDRTRCKWRTDGQPRGCRRNPRPAS